MAKPKTKKIIRIAAWCLTIAGVFVVLGFVEDHQAKMICTDLQIRIDDGKSEMSFVDEDQIITKIAENGNAVVGEPMSMLHIDETEAMIKGLPAVEDAEVYKTIDGKVVVKINQRKPILRIINKDSTSFYVDDAGKIMPLSKRYTARVLVVNGNIQEPLEGMDVATILENDSLTQAHLLDDVYAMATFINTDPFWKAQVQHIYINASGDMEILPRVGNHRIIFGTTAMLEKKFKKLKLFYNKALKNQDWNGFETINLKYKNQIVCTKK